MLRYLFKSIRVYSDPSAMSVFLRMKWAWSQSVTGWSLGVWESPKMHSLVCYTWWGGAKRGPPADLCPAFYFHDQLSGLLTHTQRKVLSNPSVGLFQASVSGRRLLVSLQLCDWQLPISALIIWMSRTSRNPFSGDWWKPVSKRREEKERGERLSRQTAACGNISAGVMFPNIQPA